MSTRLDSKPQIHTLASDLGLRRSDKPCGEILRYVEARVRTISKKFTCTTLGELLLATANEVGTVFKEIHSESDLESLREEYLHRGELIFANLANDLARPDDYGITVAVHPKKAWEPRFVSIIDCRGDKGFRMYFTKWHELAHLLTLTQQMRLLFRRSHSRENSGDPEEKLMDVIASAIGFLPDFLPETANGELSFEVINEIKKEFCPGASMQAATIGIVKGFPGPCILLEAEMAFKKSESIKATQLGFGFDTCPSPTLRAVHATVNGAAREAGVQFFRNWQVPPTSVITNVYRTGAYSEADEDLSWWSASGGKHLSALAVRVKAKKFGDAVQALLIPTRQD